MRSLALAVALLPSAYALTYSASDTYVGSDFLTSWTHQAIPDPTHGRVNYVDQDTALAKNLTYASDDTLILRADYTTTLRSGGPGRDSVRIRSNKTYKHHVVVFDARHMPQGCGTWPAFWETAEDNWPAGGEVDILEGVNGNTINQVTLHTLPGCTMPSNRGPMIGSAGNLDCQGNNGCGVQATGIEYSYGTGFNSVGGGWYAMERTSKFIKVWFWPRYATVPDDVREATDSVNTDAWGTPIAYFPNTQCNLDRYFAPNSIIINLTFCGDWAGNAYGGGCPSDCVNYVESNPAAFQFAYWDIASVRVYENAVNNAHEIHPNGNNGKCLDVKDGVMAEGNIVRIFNCNGTPAQQWLINSGKTKIQVAGTDLCLDAGSARNGVLLKLSKCKSDTTSQTWFYTGDQRIALMDQGQCLDDDSGKHTSAQMWTCMTNEDNQVWTLLQDLHSLERGAPKAPSRAKFVDQNAAYHACIN